MDLLGIKYMVFLIEDPVPTSVFLIHTSIARDVLGEVVEHYAQGCLKCILLRMVELAVMVIPPTFSSTFLSSYVV